MKIIVGDVEKEKGRERRAQTLPPSSLPVSNLLDRTGGKVLATFPAFLSGYSGDKWDNLVLSIVVPRSAKLDGFKLTDHRGVLFNVTVESLEVDFDDEEDEAHG